MITFFGAVLAGGREDLDRSSGMLDNSQIVEFIRQGLSEDWTKVQALSRRLAHEGTVSGRDAWEML
jgi:hypothetical protein